MTSSSKILTVSYGTFSCTLEGFDDAFGTMKAIAEYFRELTAEHPYFGAVPPAPDAETLQRIAERETRRRIDARVGDGGVVLRPASERRPAPPSGEARRTANGAQGETIAERLARLRALVARSREADGPVPASIFAEDEPAEPAGQRAAPAEIRGMSDAGPSALVSSETDAIVEGEDSAAAEEGKRFELPEAAPSGAEDVGGPHSIPEPQAAAGEPSLEDAVDMTPQDRPEDDPSARASDASGALPESGAAGGTEPEPPAPPPATEEGDQAEPPAADARPAAARPVFGPRLGKVGPRLPAGRRPADAEDGTVEEQLRALLGRRTVAEAAPPAAETPAGQAPATPPTPASAEAAPAEDDPAGQRPREGRGFLADAPGGPDDDYIDRIAETARSQFEEAENKRRLASLSHLKAAVAATVADRVLGDQDAHSHGDEPETELDRYRDDLSRLVPGGRGPEREGGPRPPAHPLVLVSSQRVDPPAAAEDALPAPIRNVVSRLEDPVAATAAVGASSFADFARAVGASTLPDLLEAAAAYLALHEGQEHFSRPQIMRKIAQVTNEDDFSREEGLRSFGALLRTGRLQKVRRGQFTISKNSRFRDGTRDGGR